MVRDQCLWTSCRANVSATTRTTCIRAIGAIAEEVDEEDLGAHIERIAMLLLHGTQRSKLDGLPSVLFLKGFSLGLGAGGVDYSSFRESCRVLQATSHLIALKLSPAKRELLVAAVIIFAQDVSDYAVDAYGT